MFQQIKKCKISVLNFGEKRKIEITLNEDLDIFYLRL